MDNMASAETNDKDVLKQLVANTTTQYNAIKMILQELKTHRDPITLAAIPTAPTRH